MAEKVYVTFLLVQQVSLVTLHKCIVQTLKEHGRLDMLVCNAGVSPAYGDFFKVRACVHMAIVTKGDFLWQYNYF